MANNNNNSNDSNNSNKNNNSNNELTFIESTLLSVFRGIVSIFEYLKQNSIISLTFRLILSSFQLWMSLITVFWSAVFIYVLFYWYYIPVVMTTKEVHLQFDSRCDPIVSPNCDIPYEEISLTKHSQSGQFIRGQMYSFAIDLHLPESEVNINQGMFMIRIKLFDDQNRNALNVAKPAILPFRSAIRRLIHILFYWPLFVINLIEESQVLSVTLIDNFIEGSHPNVGPITSVRIEIEARNIQISPPTILRISAQLTGLRYYMYYWTVTSAVIGIATIASFIYLIFFISHIKNQNEIIVIDNNEFDDQFDDTNNGLKANDSDLTGDIDESEGSSVSMTSEIVDIIEDINQNPDSSTNPIQDSSINSNPDSSIQ